MNKEQKLSNLYDSLLEARNCVQALAAGGEIEDARENQHITGCMTGLANTLLNQPYRIIIEQQAELLKSIQQINNLMLKKPTTMRKKLNCSAKKLYTMQQRWPTS